MVKQSMLTTVDNPYDPFDFFREWYTWDQAHGYHSTSLLARLTISSDDLSEVDILLSTEKAIDEIVDINPTGMHVKVTKEFPKEEIVDPGPLR